MLKNQKRNKLNINKENNKILILVIVNIQLSKQDKQEGKWSKRKNKKRVKIQTITYKLNNKVKLYQKLVQEDNLYKTITKQQQILIKRKITPNKQNLNIRLKHL